MGARLLSLHEALRLHPAILIDTCVLIEESPPKDAVHIPKIPFAQRRTSLVARWEFLRRKSGQAVSADLRRRRTRWLDDQGIRAADWGSGTLVVFRSMTQQIERAPALADALIAAECIARRWALLTANVGDFEGLSRLSLVDAGHPSSGGAGARQRLVALLGGSFNPPHVAHLMAAYWILATQGVDEVWLLPAFRHPFGKSLAPFPDRVRMCELAISELDHGRVKVCADEAELAADPLVGKTARTLEHLASKYPSTRFALAVGSDVLGETTKWYRWDRVQELARIIVVGREGHPEGARGAPLLPPISSTAVRERLERREPVSDVVPASVLEYIAARGLYRG